MAAEEDCQRDDGGAEAHSRADQLDDVNRANRLEAGFADHSDEADEPKDQENEKDPDESTPFVHERSSLVAGFVMMPSQREEHDDARYQNEHCGGDTHPQTDPVAALQKQ